MPSENDNNKQILENQTKVANSVNTLQQRVEEVAKKLDLSSSKALADLDADTRALVENAGTAAADGLAKIEEIKKDIEADRKEKEKLENELKDLRAAFNRPSSGGSTPQDNDIAYRFKNAIAAYVRTGGRRLMDDTLTNEIATKIANEKFFGDDAGREIFKNDIVSKTQEAGGILFTPQMSTEMKKRIYETSPLIQESTIIQLGTDTYEQVLDTGEGHANWVGETDTRTSGTTPVFGKVSIAMNQIYGQVAITNKMMANPTIDIASWIQEKETSKIARTRNTAYVSGNGVNKPKGLLSYDAWDTNTSATVKGVYQDHKIEQVSSGTNGVYVANTLIILQNALLEAYQGNAKWMIKRSEFPNMALLKVDGIGRYLIDPQLYFNGPERVLLGKPIIFADDMPVAATNSLSVFYGDIRETYTIIEGTWSKFIVDPYTQKGYTIFFIEEPNGGGVTNFESGKLYKLAA